MFHEITQDTFLKILLATHECNLKNYSYPLDRWGHDYGRRKFYSTLVSGPN